MNRIACLIAFVVTASTPPRRTVRTAARPDRPGLFVFTGDHTGYTAAR